MPEPPSSTKLQNGEVQEEANVKRRGEGVAAAGQGASGACRLELALKNERARTGRTNHRQGSGLVTLEKAFGEGVDVALPMVPPSGRSPCDCGFWSPGVTRNHQEAT